MSGDHFLFGVGKHIIGLLCWSSLFLTMSLFSFKFKAWVKIAGSLPSHESCGKSVTTRAGHSCPQSKADFQLKIGTPGSISVWWDPTSIKAGWVAAVQGPPLCQTTPWAATKLLPLYYQLKCLQKYHGLLWRFHGVVILCQPTKQNLGASQKKTKLLIDGSLFPSPPSKAETK